MAKIPIQCGQRPTLPNGKSQKVSVRHLAMAYEAGAKGFHGIGYAKFVLPKR